jgi:hypothetical protein
MDDAKIRAAISLRAFCEIVLERLEESPEAADAEVILCIEDLCEAIDRYTGVGANGLTRGNGAG